MNVLIAKKGFQRCGLVSEKLEELVDSLYLAYDSFKVKDVGAAIIAKCNSKILVTDGLRSSLPTETLVNAIPLVSSLNNPTIKEIVDELDAKVLFGAEFLNNEIGNYSVGCSCETTYTP
jgi:phosphate acetyltransferase